MKVIKAQCYSLWPNLIKKELKTCDVLGNFSPRTPIEGSSENNFSQASP